MPNAGYGGPAGKGSDARPVPYQGRITGSLHGSRLGRGGVALIADVQYGDAATRTDGKLDDRPADGRLYSLTLGTFRRSARRARELGAASLVLLGDQVDDRDRVGDAAATAVLTCADEELAACPVGYLLGNHDTKWTQTFRAARARAPVVELPGCFAWECEVDSEDGSPPWVLLALDCYATAFAAESKWGRQLPPDGEVGAAQLSWLRARLGAARQALRDVVVLSHVPLSPRDDRSQDAPAGRIGCVRDAEHVRRVLQDAGCVRLCVAGHYHPGAYHFDAEANIHFVTLTACLSEGPLTGALLRVRRGGAVLSWLRDGGQLQVQCAADAPATAAEDVAGPARADRAPAMDCPEEAQGAPPPSEQRPGRPRKQPRVKPPNSNQSRTGTGGRPQADGPAARSGEVKGKRDGSGGGPHREGAGLWGRGGAQGGQGGRAGAWGGRGDTGGGAGGPGWGRGYASGWGGSGQRS